MTFWSKLLLVYMLAMQGPTEVKGQTVEPSPKAKLRCYTCSSPNSWEECDNNSEVVPCEAEGDDACLKITMHKWEIVNGTKSDRVITHYAKYCAQGEDCSDKQCRELGWRCIVDCCTQDLCNASVSIWVANNVLIAVLLGLAVCNIVIAF